MSARVMVRLLVLAIGVFYVVLAISGFASSSDETTVGGGLRGGNEPALLWGFFSVNTVLNFIHFLFGALTVITSFLIDRTKLLAWTMSGAFMVLFAYDIISLLTFTGTDPLAINGPDAWLHAITAMVLIIASLVPIANPAEHQGERDRNPRVGRDHRSAAPTSEPRTQ